LQISSDNALLYSGSSDGSIRYWDQQKQHDELFFQDNSGVLSMAISPNNNFLFVGFKDNIVKVWNLAEKRKIDEINLESSPIQILCFQKQPKILISTYNALLLFKIENPFQSVQIGAIKAENKYFSSISINEQSSELFVGCSTGEICIYDLNTLEFTKSYQKYALPIYSMSLSSNQQLLATGLEKLIFIWHFPKPEPMYILDDIQGLNKNIQFITYDNHPILITGDDEGFITLWDFRFSEELFHFQADSHIIHKMLISPNNQYLFTNNGDNFIKKWDLIEILETSYKLRSKSKSELTSSESRVNSKSTSKTSKEKKEETNPIIKKIMPTVEKVFETFEDQIKDAAEEQLGKLKEIIIDKIKEKIGEVIPTNFITNKIIDAALPKIVNDLIEKLLDKACEKVVDVAYDQVQNKIKETNAKFNSETHSNLPIDTAPLSSYTPSSSASPQIISPFQNTSIETLEVLKKRVKGIIKIKKMIPINEVAEILNINPKLVQSWIYELAGEDKIEGDFDGDGFKFTNELNAVIDAVIEKIK